MTCKALTTRLALVALTMSAMAGQSTIYANAGNVIGRYATDRQGTTTLYGRDGQVTRSGQVFGGRPKWRQRRRPAPDQ